MTPLEKILAALRSRKDRQARFGYGIGTADQYLKSLVQCSGEEACRNHFAGALQERGLSWDQIVKEAGDKLVYANPETTIDEKSVVTNSSDFRSMIKSPGIEVPPRTIMVFRNVITTPFRDRDGDILETLGADPDPQMPLLWQHVHLMPIGKMLEIVDHNSKVLRVTSAVIDSALGNDTAQLIEFGALRISHGFLPKEFEELRGDEDHPFGGFKVLRFEIMEESTVSVPSNTQAVIELFSRGKLTDPIVKQWAGHYFDNRETRHMVAGVEIISGKVTVPAGSKDTVNVWTDPEGGVTVQVQTEEDPKSAESGPDVPGDATPAPGADAEPSCGCSGEDAKRRHEQYPGGKCSNCGKEMDDAGVCINCGTAGVHEDDRRSAGLRKDVTLLRMDKGFEPAQEYLEPSKLEYDWVSRYLGCEVKNIHKIRTFVGNLRKGSWLSGLREAMRDWREDDCRCITLQGREVPPTHDLIQLNSRMRDTFLVDGLSFSKHGREKAVVKLEEDWNGIDVTVYVSTEQADVGAKLLINAWDWCEENNFLKGEAFSLLGDFLERDGTDWADVFLPEENKKAVRRAVDVLNDKGKNAANRGIIMMGPPGTGKTLSGRIMKNTAKSTFIWISARDFWKAGAMGGLTMGFDLARELSPSVLFIEDVDNWLGERQVDLIKTEMDGIAQSSGVLTVLTTNYPERLPDALIDRPGRFHDVLQFDLPASGERMAMLRAWYTGLSDKALTNAVKSTEGYSGAHVRELCNFAKTIAEEEDLDAGSAIERAIKRVDEQRELINQSQLAGSNYRPNREAGLLAKYAKELGVLSNKAVVPYQNTPAAPQGREWDSDAAVTRLRVWARGDADELDLALASHRNKYRKGFTWVREAGENLGDYMLPHHDVIGGELQAVFRGMSAAIGAINGARAQISLNDDERRQAYNHVARHYRDRFPDQTVPEFQAAADPEPKSTEKRGGLIDGSWEWIEKLLWMAATSFLRDKGVNVGDEDFVKLIGTFADHGIIGLFSKNMDAPKFFKVSWTMEDDKPIWTGDPEAVEMSTTVVERALAGMTADRRSFTSVAKELLVLAADADTETLKRIGLGLTRSAEVRENRVEAEALEAAIIKLV